MFQCKKLLLVESAVIPDKDIQCKTINSYQRS